MLNNDSYARQQRELRNPTPMERPPLLGTMSGRLLVCIVGAAGWGYVLYGLFAALRQPLVAVVSSQSGVLRWYDIASRLFLLLSSFVIFGACSWLGWSSIFKLIRNTLIGLFIVALLSVFMGAIFAGLSGA